MTAPPLTTRQRQLLEILVAGGPMTVQSVAASIGIGRPTATGHLKFLEHRGLVAHTFDPGNSRRFLWEAAPAAEAADGGPANSQAPGTDPGPQDAPALAGVVFAVLAEAAEPVRADRLGILIVLRERGGPLPAERDVRDAVAWLACPPHAILAAEPGGWRFTSLGTAMRDMAEAERENSPDEVAPPGLRLFLLASRCTAAAAMPAWIAAGLASWAGLGRIGAADPGETRSRWELVGDTGMIAWEPSVSAGGGGWLLAVSARRPGGSWVKAREVQVPDLAELAYQIRETVGSRPDAPLAWRPGGFYMLSGPGWRDPGLDAVRQRIAGIIAGESGAGQATTPPAGGLGSASPGSPRRLSGGGTGSPQAGPSYPAVRPSRRGSRAICVAPGPGGQAA